MNLTMKFDEGNEEMKANFGEVTIVGSGEVVPKQQDILYGKKLVMLGDSFTHSVANSLIVTKENQAEKWTTIAGDNYDNTFSSVVYDRTAGQWVEQNGSYKTYDYWIAKRNNMKLWKLTEAGRTLSDIATDGNSIAKVYTNIPTDADYILIKIGINDYKQNASIGTVEYDDNGTMKLNTSANTFCGAFNNLMRFLTEVKVSGSTYPKTVTSPYNKTKIGIIVTNGASADIVNATIEVAKYWGIPYLNEDGETTLSLVHSTNSRPIGSRTSSWTSMRFSTAHTNIVGWSDFHPNLLAHEMESTFVEDFLRGL